MNKEHGNHHYAQLAIMAGLSFVSMYVLMYSMANSLENVFANLNELYMAALMTFPMLIIEVSLMSTMFQNKTWNIVIIAISALAVIVSFSVIRMQTAISDEQFLKSMIPHHASAILMCGRAHVKDHEIVELCKNIVASQQAEIDQMKAILSKL